MMDRRPSSCEGGHETDHTRVKMCCCSNQMYARVSRKQDQWLACPVHLVERYAAHLVIVFLSFTYQALKWNQPPLAVVWIPRLTHTWISWIICLASFMFLFKRIAAACALLISLPCSVHLTNLPSFVLPSRNESELPAYRLQSFNCRITSFWQN